MFISDEYLLFSFWNIVFLVISLGSVGFFVLKAMKTPGKLQENLFEEDWGNFVNLQLHNFDDVCSVI